MVVHVTVRVQPPPVHRLLFSLSASPPHDEPVQVHDPERQKQIGLIKEQHTLTCTATHTWPAAVADGLRAAQPLAEQAAEDEDELHLLFESTFAARAEQLGLNVGAPTYGAAGPYLKVARSTPCFVRLLAATGAASCHGRCARTAALSWGSDQGRRGVRPRLNRLRTRETGILTPSTQPC